MVKFDMIRSLLIFWVKNCGLDIAALRSRRRAAGRHAAAAEAAAGATPPACLH